MQCAGDYDAMRWRFRCNALEISINVLEISMQCAGDFDAMCWRFRCNVLEIMMQCAGDYRCNALEIMLHCAGDYDADYALRWRL